MALLVSLSLSQSRSNPLHCPLQEKWYGKDDTPTAPQTSKFLVTEQRLQCPHLGLIIQRGPPRSATTFQWYMLCSIQRACLLLHRPNASMSMSVHCMGRPPKGQVLKVSKTHDPPSDTTAHRPAGAPEISWFETCRAETDCGRPQPRDIYFRQPYSDFARVGLEGVLFYVMAPLFGLPEDAIQAVHEHMKYWAILRQCCGSQQSVDHRLELHGVTQEQQEHMHHPQGSYDDPDCEKYNLEVVEQLFLGTRLARAFPDELWLAFGRDQERIRRGMCASEAKKIRDGADFNGKAWKKPDYIVRASPPPPSQRLPAAANQAAANQTKH